MSIRSPRRMKTDHGRDARATFSQEKIYHEYVSMAEEFNFVTIDASRSPDIEHRDVRRLVQQRVDLPRYKWRIRP